MACRRLGGIPCLDAIMAPLLTSSGDLAADRRLSYADALLAEGDARAAADLMRETMPTVPMWTAGWMRLGEMADAAGDATLAQEAYAQALATDPSDRFGATLRLDLHRAVPLAERVPAAHVEALFDDYAPRFEASLVGALGYCGPDRIAEALSGPLGRVLDLGCGTGLMGAAIVGRYDWLGGYDLSARMLAQAKDKAIYDHLEQRDLATLMVDGSRYDTIIAADVFIYIGTLERIIGWVAASLTDTGRFAFTVEVHDGAGVKLQPSHRYAHSERYIRSLLDVAGFRDVQLSQTTLRQDRGEPITALIVTAHAPLRTSDREGEAEETMA